MWDSIKSISPSLEGCIFSFWETQEELGFWVLLQALIQTQSKILFGTFYFWLTGKLCQYYFWTIFIHHNLVLKPAGAKEGLLLISKK